MEERQPKEVDLLDRYLAIIEKEALYSSTANFLFYSDYLFDGVSIEGRTLLDVGGGWGLHSFYALCRGAKQVVCLEPETAGSRSGARDLFERIRLQLGKPQNIRLEDATIQSFEPMGQNFDIILMNHSINHLDEEACIHLHENPSARETYVKIACEIHELASTGAHLIIADCSRQNFFAHLHVRNPFIRKIEWHKHQSPYRWAGLFGAAGFENPRIRWTSFSPLRSWGRLLMGNPVAAYFLTSHFCLDMTRGDSPLR